MTELAPPVLVGNLYLDVPLPELDGEGRYQGARLLAWLHGRPLGEIVLPLGGPPVPARRLADEVWSVLGERIAKHCADDGISPPAQPAGDRHRPARAGALCRPPDARPTSRGSRW